MTFESWRNMGPEDQAAFLSFADSGLRARWVEGQETYHSDVLGFQGNPLDHAIEECLGLLFYLWMEKRRQRDAARN